LLTSGRTEPIEAQSRRRWLTFLYTVPLAGLIGVILYAAAVGPFARTFSVALLLAGCAWIGGAFFGFLFGIPRSVGAVDANAQAGVGHGYRSNTNLEQISDWLTKILVGLSLVEFGRLLNAMRRLGDFVGPTFGGGQTGSTFALTTVVLFAISGFLALYIVTRVYVGVLFARTEVSLSSLAKEIDRTQKLASEADEQTKAAVPEPDLAGEAAPQLDFELVTVDPSSALAVGRGRVVEAIVNLYQLLYASQPADAQAAIKRLQGDGYLDDTLGQLARQILDVTRGAINEQDLPADQVRALIDSCDKFLRSLGRIASLNFEAEVDKILRQLPGSNVERRSQRVGREGRVPDFVVSAEGKGIVAEAYLPQYPPRTRLLEQRITARLPFVGEAGAAGLLVVVPNGVDLQALAVEERDGVALMTVDELRQSVADDSLLTHPAFA